MKTLKDLLFTGISETKVEWKPSTGSIEIPNTISKSNLQDVLDFLIGGGEE